jgi:hypothetical protein
MPSVDCFVGNWPQEIVTTVQGQKGKETCRKKFSCFYPALNHAGGALALICLLMFFVDLVYVPIN